MPSKYLLRDFGCKFLVDNGIGNNSDIDYLKKADLLLANLVSKDLKIKEVKKSL